MKTKPNTKKYIKKKHIDPCSLEIHDSLESRIERIKKETKATTPSNYCPLTIHDSIESRIERINKH
ncbi:hypothetical protein [Methanonatronarchaeum sp. AMET-Sl]|uniref:hypothetical protein n=1 Tax=Methanonatronarchaeum sp. AMET-Sl TaxID=3037654 RepID=UPI00244E53F1|nr:hypothetical protein [Methanonatronarchaeum sp. AMET-Sl]WGI17768.1 hypothetical protein QEN48_01820 [Methanonatronarchaeum sp. AMET-Sl]